MFGAQPGRIGGCTVNDSTGRPAVRITEPYPGTGYRAQPVPGYRPVSHVPSTQYRPYGGYIGLAEFRLRDFLRTQGESLSPYAQPVEATVLLLKAD